MGDKVSGPPKRPYPPRVLGGQSPSILGTWSLWASEPTPTPEAFDRERNQSFQKSLLKEYGLNHVGIPNRIFKVYSFIQDFWKLWEKSISQPASMFRPSGGCCNLGRLQQVAASHPDPQKPLN